VGELQGVSARTEKAGRPATITSYAPATGEALGEVPIFGEAEVRSAVARAREAQKSWALLPLEERVERLLRLRDTIVDEAESIVDLVVAECGKPRAEALTHDVMITANLATFYAKNASRILAPKEIELQLLKHRRSYLHYAPRGVVAIISPWNFPFVIPMGDVFPALIAGNAVVLKPSEVTPLVALKAKEIYDAAGLPDDLFSVVTGDGATGAALIDAKPDKVIFTGAVSTGRRVAAACGERLIPCTMELGGKAPLIVCADADVERAARAIVFGGFANSGQACVSVERVYAHASVYDRLVSRTRELVVEIRQGDPSRYDTDVGAIIFSKQIDVAEKLIADAVDKGARLEAGGKRLPGKGQFFQPTLLSGCTQDMDVMREEIFGPVVPIMKVADEDQAVALANDSHLGLMGYVFTKDRDKGRRLAERVRAGTVMVNDVLLAYAAPEAPFGGIKDSGFGRVHGEEGLREMCEIRHVNYDRIPVGSRDPLWFPYGETTYKATLKGLRLLFRRGNPVKKILDLF
jgi:succinate-semialdehyde dehydrogenase/glutarate-semialdehyde dehydrogenase